MCPSQLCIMSPLVSRYCQTQPFYRLYCPINTFNYISPGYKNKRNEIAHARCLDRMSQVYLLCLLTRNQAHL